MSQEIHAFGKVAVLMGGWAAEREVSLKSGRSVLNALEGAGVDVHGVDLSREGVAQLTAGSYDRVFNIVHGRGGEDGELQGALEIAQIPYTGCGVMASAISMDKLMTKRLWRGMNLPTPEYRVLDAETDWSEVVDSLGLPLIIKPALEGSSIGMSKVDSQEELPAAYELAAEYGEVFAEQWVTGSEYTVAIVNGEVLPSIRLQVSNAFYDYEAKYQSNDTQYFCPSGLSDDAELEIAALAQRAFNAVGGRGWGRVDVMCSQQGDFVLIEVNTVPGMTDHSLVPMAAKQQGYSFESLVLNILSTARLT
ncbi:MAG: D-alanine--D-alanine ligase [Thiotrichaceae bacterium]|nr:D-alanine--D-alanine ligase [Thiotrichaceae bacterium]